MKTQSDTSLSSKLVSNNPENFSHDISLPKEATSKTPTKLNNEETTWNALAALPVSEYLLLVLQIQENETNEAVGRCDKSNNELKSTNTSGSKYDRNVLYEFINGIVSETSRKKVFQIFTDIQTLPSLDYTRLHSTFLSKSLENMPAESNVSFDQAVVWIKTHLEEEPNRNILKRKVYSRYCYFCGSNDIKPLNSTDFEILVKEVYPNVRQIRIGSKNRWQFCYSGVKSRQILPSPSLPQLSNNQDKAETSDVICLKNENEPDIKLENASTSEFKESTSDSTVAVSEEKVHIEDLGGNKNCAAIPNLLSKAPNNIKRYKEYRHASVKALSETHKNIKIPVSVYRQNIDPAIVLTAEVADNWQMNQLLLARQHFLNLSIINIENTSDYRVSCRCCNTKQNVNHSNAIQLQHMKRKLLSLPVTQSSKPQEMHSSVKELLKENPNIEIPTEVFGVPINPVITLNKNDVLSWYVSRVSELNHRIIQMTESTALLLNDLSEVASTIPNKMSAISRQSRARMMNFCESTSSDSDNSDADYLGASSSSSSSDSSDTNVLSKLVTEKRKVLKRRRSPSVRNLESQPLAKKKTVNANLQGGCKASPLPIPVQQLHNEPASNIKNGQTVTPAFACELCKEPCRTEDELSKHESKHLTCRACKRKLKDLDVTRQHLEKHCIANRNKGKPYLALTRIDSMRSMKEKYSEAFHNFKTHALTPINLSGSKVSMGYLINNKFVLSPPPPLTAIRKGLGQTKEVNKIMFPPAPTNIDKKLNKDSNCVILNSVDLNQRYTIKFTQLADPASSATTSQSTNAILPRLLNGSNAMQLQKQSVAQQNRNNAQQIAVQVQKQNAAQLQKQNTIQLQKQIAAQQQKQNAAQLQKQNAVELQSQNTVQLQKQNAIQLQKQIAAQQQKQNSAQLQKQNAAELQNQNTMQQQKQNAVQLQKQVAAQQQKQFMIKLAKQNIVQLQKQNPLQLKKQNVQVQRQKTVTLQKQNTVQQQQQNTTQQQQQNTVQLQQQNTAQLQKQNTTQLQKQNVMQLQKQNAVQMKNQNSMLQKLNVLKQQLQQNTVQLQKQNTMTQQQQQQCAVVQLQQQNSVQPQKQVLPVTTSGANKFFVLNHNNAGIAVSTTANLLCGGTYLLNNSVGTNICLNPTTSVATSGVNYVISTGFPQTEPSMNLQMVTAPTLIATTSQIDGFNFQQDHTYHQTPVMQVNDTQSLNQTNLTLNQSCATNINIASPVLQDTNIQMVTDNSTSSSGSFKIRVRDIKELS